MQEFLKSFLGIISNIMISAFAGIVSFKISQKLEIAKQKKEIWKYSLENICTPIFEALPKCTNCTIQEIYVALITVNDIYKNNTLYVPEAHIVKIKFLLSYFDLYNKTQYKEVLEKEILKQYKKFYHLVDIYINEIKKNLGFQYNSIFQYVKYSTTDYFNLCASIFFLVIFVAVYITLVFIGETVWAIILLLIVSTIYIIGVIACKSIADAGGILLVIKNLTGKLKNKIFNK
jgi:hypothetical protein